MPIEAIFLWAAEDAAATAAMAEAATAAEAAMSAEAAAAASEPMFANSMYPTFADAGFQGYNALNALTPAQQAYLEASSAALDGTQALPGTSPVIPGVKNAAAEMTPEAYKPLTTPPLTNPETGQQYFLENPPATPVDKGLELLNKPDPSFIDKYWKPMSPFQQGMAMFTGATGLARLGAFSPGGSYSSLEPYSGSLSKYRISPNFQPRVANPTEFQYTPRRYAEGGIADVPSYKKGGNLSSATEFYKMMTGERAESDSTPRRAPSAGIDTGIYYDTDPDTQRLDALTAAQIRMAKVNKRTGMQGQGMPRPQGLGQLNLAPIGTKAGQEQQYQDITAAQGGIMQAYANGGPVERMSGANAVGANTGYPMANISQGAYATPYQQPISQNVLSGAQDARVDPYTGQERLASGGIASLGGYAAGGNPRLLSGPGDGMSDDIPAMIGSKQPARLADGEFVIPADVVSHLGNGSTKAGAEELDKMMKKVRRARTGNPKQGKQINPAKYMPK